MGGAAEHRSATRSGLNGRIFGIRPRPPRRLDDRSSARSASAMPTRDPLDTPLEDLVSLSIADAWTEGVYVLDRRDLARRAALDGFRQGIELAAKVVAEMQADHGSDLLAEAVLQIRSLPKDVP